MSNPIAVKPATAVWTSAVSSTMKAAVGLCEGAGGPVESVSGTVAMPGTGYQCWGTGRAPAWNASGFNSSPILSFGYQAQTLYFPYATGVSTARTYYCVIRLTNTYLHVTASGRNKYICYPANLSGDNWINGIYLLDGLLGYYHDAVSYLTGSNNLATMVLEPGRWYAVAIAINEPSSPYTRQFHLYDYAAQALHGASGQGGAFDTSATTHVSNKIGFNVGNNQAITNSPGVQPFDLYCAGVDGAAWAATDFATFFADPSYMVRGTYAASGGLTAGTSRLWDQTATTVYLGASRATGTGTGGTGSPTYQWYRSLKSADTPGSGSMPALANGGGVGGATTLNLTDGSVAANTPYFYKLQASDGSSTANYPQVAAIADLKTIVRFGGVGDSTMQHIGTVQEFCRTLHGLGRRASFANAAVAGSFASGATGLVWPPTATPAAANEQWTVTWTNGTPTAGDTFTITDPTSGQTTAAIAYNATAATIAAALGATSIGGANQPTSSGGPLPTSVTLTWSQGTNAALTRLIGYATSSSAATGTIAGTHPVVTITRSAYGLAATTGNNLYNQALSMFLADGVTWAIIDLRANDASSSVTQSTYLTALTAIVNGFTGSGINVVLMAPKYRMSSATTGSEDASPAAGDETIIELIRQYGAAMNGLANGTTVLWGGYAGYRYSVEDFQDFSDGLHPTSGTGQVGIGQFDLGACWAHAAVAAVEPATLYVINKIITNHYYDSPEP